MPDQPILIGARPIEDNDLRQMLVDTIANNETEDFFSRFEFYGFPADPFGTLIRGEALLSRCRRLHPDAYARLHKGTPFYWLAWAAFTLHDYETAAFYIDAAVSDDLKAADETNENRNNVSNPAVLFFLINPFNPDQALGALVHILRKKVDSVIDDYNNRGGAAQPALTFTDLQSSLFRRAILRGNEHLRTLVTTLISFLMEWDHRSELIQLRTERGTAEPFFMHLFKGCVLFESLLKTNTARPIARGNDTLGRMLGQLQSNLLFGTNPPIQKKIGRGYDLEAIINSLKSNDNSTYTAVVRTAQIRNTTGHNLGWQVALSLQEYNQLASYVASSCLHAVACLYR